MKLKIIFCTLFTSCLSFASAQIHTDDVTSVRSPHQDTSYHCATCSHHLFDAEEATAINQFTLHISGDATDNTKTAFHCAGCKSQVGHYNHQHDLYQVVGDRLKEEEHSFLCLSCQLPLFKKQELFTSNDVFAYFSSPIDEERIALAETSDFYKIQMEDVKCGRCDSQLGEAQKYDSGGFGMRMNIGALKKRKKQ